MIDKHKTLTVGELLLGEDKYSIPLYQRNFSWTYDEIKQLIIDIADACREKKERYYIGTLVVDEKFHIIDGQQRTTALTLLALVLKKDYSQDCLQEDHLIQEIHLSFEARKQSNQTLIQLNEENDKTENDGEQKKNELILGYENTQIALKEVLEGENIKVEEFCHYLFEKVCIFRNMLSSKLDLNLYFERFNSRGEQLEAHEIIKARLMAELDKEVQPRFAKIWDACAEFDKPVISFFKKKAKKADVKPEEREKIFLNNPGDYHFSYTLKLGEQLELVETDEKETGKSLLEYLKADSPQTEEVSIQDDDMPKYRTIVNFETFLYYAYYIYKNEQDKIQLDDKKLQEKFEPLIKEGQEEIIGFTQTLLTLKFIFDNFIIRNSLEAASADETKWILKKVARHDVHQKKGAHYYVQDKYDGNTFDKNINDTIIQLQSMFAVTFTANRDSKWLYEIMKYLYENVGELTDEDFGEKFLKRLEKMAAHYAKERIFNEGRNLKPYDQIPVYAFNFVDYVLWKNRINLKDQLFDAENFRFTYRRSIEHWFPQNPSEDMGKQKLDNTTLHSFGNLCIITNSQNSRFSNLSPISKYNEWERIFDRQSLKLQMMAKRTKAKANGAWEKEDIDKMTEDMKTYITEFIEEHASKNI